ncbi:MAG: hypothetical protein QOI92_1594, partial [Chloroflexota bacterium]|nr:hypothetical protein [Chloroflexota bacterium]
VSIGAAVLAAVLVLFLRDQPRPAAVDRTEMPTA